MKRTLTSNLFLLFLTLLLLVLELLPYGVVLRFEQPSEEDGELLQTYSYFDLTPWEYGYFTPLLTALLSVVLLILVLAALFWRKSERKLFYAIGIVALVAAILSGFSLGTKQLSLYTGAILACLLLIAKNARVAARFPWDPS